MINSKHKIYTRYKYTQYGKTLDFSTYKWNDKYQVIPSSGTNVNGQPTRLTESVRVVLGGNVSKNLRIYKQDAYGDYQEMSSGSILIK